MKHFFSLVGLVGLLLASGLVSVRATQPICENDAPILFPPQIDCTVFVNRSDFNVGSTFLLYDFSNCRFFTNTGSGTMTGNPGFRFDHVVTHSFPYNRFAADSFVNQGQISVATNLLVFATNVMNSGDLFTGAGGIIRLHATNAVDVGRSGLRSGPSDQFFFGGGFVTGGTYINDAGISDVYWGAGNNNTLDNSGNPMPLQASTNFFAFPNFAPPNPQSPSHQVLVAGSTFTNTVSVPGGLFGIGLGRGQYDAFVYTNTVNATSAVIQMVFAPTNTVDTNFQTRVGFLPGYRAGRAGVVVEFSMVDFDIVLQRNITNYVYLTDLTATMTNIALLRNAVGTTRRPASMEVTRGQAFFGTPPNAVYSTDLVINPFYRTNQVNVMYAAYSAQIGEASTAGGFGFGFLFPLAFTATEPTNMAGRIELAGETLNLEQTRVRAESVFRVRTRNLTSNFVGQVDAPFLIYDLGTREPSLVISNLAPPTVRRLSGQVSAWAGVWTNFADVPVMTGTNVVTNTTQIAFHALIVDNQLSSLRPVVMHEFAAHATNLVIRDPFVIGRSLFVEATNVHIQGSLTLPPGGSWAASNVVSTVNFTNDGALVIPQVGFFGSDRPVPYDSFVNRGNLSGSSLKIRTRYFENTGSPIAAAAGTLTAQEGILSVMVASGTGSLSNSLLSANGDVELFADNLEHWNSTIVAGSSNRLGALILAATNRLSDGGLGTSNYWLATAGFRVPVKAQVGDLFGTTIESRITRVSGAAQHLWAAEDRGARHEGFRDNMALGRLVLDSGANDGRFEFAGPVPDQPHALYVDFLDLRNMATNYDSSLIIRSNFTLYFANASVPPTKLDGRFGGRLRWAWNYTGPNSSTNLVHRPSGRIYTFNIARALSKDLDSDHDGIANFDEEFPFFVAESVGLTVTLPVPPQSELALTWNALGEASQWLEYTTDVTAGLWQVRTNFQGGPLTVPVTVRDSLVPNATRFYRVRIEPSPFP